MKTQILPTCLQGNYRNSLGEFGNTCFRAETIKKFGRAKGRGGGG